MKRILFILAILFVFSDIYSQDVEVGRYLNMVAQGKTDEVRQALPDLMVAYPNDPGVKLLTASVIQDAFKSVDIYNDIALNHPESKWADDALWRIIQFHAIMGNSEKANIGLTILRKSYPTSEFIVPATDIVRSSYTLTKMRKLEQPVKVEEKENEEPSNMTNWEQLKDEKVEELVKDEENEEIDKVKEERKQIKKPLKEEVSEEVMGGGELPEPKRENLVRDILQKHIEDEKKKDEENKRELKPEAPLLSSGTGFFGLQVGVFSQKINADAEMQKFLNQRMRSEVRAVKKDDSFLYAVIIGNYSTKKSAEAAKIIVNQQCGCDPIIVEK